MLRTLAAVYEVVGHRDAQDKLKAEELFRILDENSDGEFRHDEKGSKVINKSNPKGEISQEEFINIIKRDHQLLNILEKT